MEKKTLLAILLSVGVIIVYYLVVTLIFPPKVHKIEQNTPTEQVQTGEQAPQAAQTGQGQAGSPEGGPLTADETGGEAALGGATLAVEPVDQAPSEQSFINVETKLLKVKLTNAGGDIDSYELKEHKDKNSLVNMIFSGNDEPHAFSLAFGGVDAAPEQALFNVQQTRGDYGTRVKFYRDFAMNGKTFTLTKTYTFPDNEYMFSLNIDIEAPGAAAEGGAKTAAPNIPWTLYFGPQIGPVFSSQLDGRSDYRNYLVYSGGKLKTEKADAKKDAVVEGDISWISIAGKYFALIAVPPDDSGDYSYLCTMRQPEEGIPSTARLYIERKPSVAAAVGANGTNGANANTNNSGNANGAFKFYLGPKTSSELDIYDTGKNQFGLFNAGLSKAANTSGFWSILNPLEVVLKWLLNLFYKMIPNYGLAIILVTIFVKVILFPLTKKSSEGTLRMQALAPKIKELQEKYKDNPQKMNAEMGALYKREGYNPLSGCLPMLIQIPIFFAMYNLFNNHFELRGALFIPGWIPDLSLPESVYHLPFTVPFLGWQDLRLLPFIYLFSQLLYGKVTQTPDQAANNQMRMMLYIMPILFFFVLYNVPAGLLVYWIMSNVLTLVQQLIINKYLAKKKAEASLKEANEAPKRITPPKKRRRR